MQRIILGVFRIRNALPPNLIVIKKDFNAALKISADASLKKCFENS
jgi:hypothetical protein